MQEKWCNLDLLRNQHVLTQAPETKQALASSFGGNVEKEENPTVKYEASKDDGEAVVCRRKHEKSMTKS